MTTPNFTFDRSDSPPLYASLESFGLKVSSWDFQAELVTCGLHPKLVTILAELHKFSQAIAFALTESTPLDPIAFVDDSYLIRHGLLSFSTVSLTSWKQRHTAEALRLGALIYVKDLLREFPRSVIGMNILVQKLKDSLDPIAGYEHQDTVAFCHGWHVRQQRHG